jgi:hypothetical protein
MKKRNKKYSNNKLLRAIRTAESILKHFCIINVNNQDGLCRLLKLHNGEEVAVTQDVYNSLTYTRFNWSIYIAGFGFKGSENYTKSKIVISDKPYLQSELIEFLNAEHKKLLQSFNPSQLCGFGWLASPTCHDFTEEQAFKLFEQHGAFDDKEKAA